MCSHYIPSESVHLVRQGSVRWREGCHIRQRKREGHREGGGIYQKREEDEERQLEKTQSGGEDLLGHPVI